jgi:hypothetical protein
MMLDATPVCYHVLETFTEWKSFIYGNDQRYCQSIMPKHKTQGIFFKLQLAHVVKELTTL